MNTLINPPSAPPLGQETLDPSASRRNDVEGPLHNRQCGSHLDCFVPRNDAGGPNVTARAARTWIASFLAMTGYTTPVFTKTLQFSQFLNFTATAPYILYWHEGSNTLQLGKWGNHITAANYATKMLWFKLGSLVGMDLNGNFTTDNIKFNPMTNPESVIDYLSIPSYKDIDFSDGRKDVSASTYHHKTNVLAGKGDPCKLVGLTIEQIRAGNIDNKAWRLPTYAETATMTGNLTNGSAPTAGKFVISSGIWSAAALGLATFPTPEPDVVLPAVGLREFRAGAIEAQGIYGAYWNSTPGVTQGTGGITCLHFSSEIVSPANSAHYERGLSVRCVPQ